MRFEPYMAGHLGKGTRYWIGGESVSFSNLRSLKSLISGPLIDLFRPAEHFTQPPGIMARVKFQKHDAQGREAQKR